MVSSFRSFSTEKVWDVPFGYLLILFCISVFILSFYRLSKTIYRLVIVVFTKGNMKDIINGDIHWGETLLFFGIFNEWEDEL